MKWSLSLLFSFLLFSSFSGSSVSSPAYYTISGIDPGGVITTYYDRYNQLKAAGVTVKVDGLCASACTMVLAIVDPSKICMTERAAFGFHLASSDGDANPELTKAWFRLFPDWVLEWVIAKGGVESNPVYAFAEDFKGHIQLCPGSHYPTVEMQKLIKSQGEAQRQVFTPQQ